MNVIKQTPQQLEPAPHGKLGKPSRSGLTLARVVSGMALSLFVGSSIAADTRYYSEYQSNYSDIEYAKVLDASPIVDLHQISVPQEHCYQERVPVERYANHRSKKTRTPEILGAIVGAAVGNQFGGGRGNDIATAAGALLGGSIGRDIKNNARRNHHDGYGRYEVVSRCEVTHSYQTEERIVGYDVRYKYNGRVYQARMPNHPGDRIRVKVSVEPV